MVPVVRDRSQSRPETSLRILFVSAEYPPETAWGGIASYLSVLAPALARRGHEVHVLSCAPGQVHSDRRDHAIFVHRRRMIRLHGLHLVTPASADRINTTISNYLSARSLGRGFDIIEAPDWMAEGLALALRPPCPVVVHLHSPHRVLRTDTLADPGLPLTFRDRLEATTVRLAAAVSSPSRFLVRVLREHGWLHRDDIEVIPNPIDTSSWVTGTRVAATNPTVAVVGRLQQMKNPELALEAVARLALKEAEVVFVGRALESRQGIPYDQWLLRRAKHLGVSCRMLGQISPEQLLGVYERARLVLVPSRFESLSMVGLEAMAAGRPVVCTANSGLAEYVSKAGAGTVTNGDDPEEVSRRVEPFLRDRALAQIVGDRGRAAAETTFGSAAVAAQREAFYRAALTHARMEGGRGRLRRDLRAATQLRNPPGATRRRVIP